MFTGIIETVGTVVSVTEAGTNKTFRITSALSTSFKPDQSIAHNGVCLTVEDISTGTHQVTAVQETLQKTNIGEWQPGQHINIEQCMKMNGRIDGHIVQGHVDTTATCIAKAALEGSWKLSFRFPENFAALIIEKGSVAVNGISLTAFDVSRNCFSVAIIPYTYDHTNMQYLNAGDTVNIEFDVIGKYVVRGLETAKP